MGDLRGAGGDTCQSSTAREEGGEMLALAERLVAATGPCRALDAGIAFATGWRQRHGLGWKPPGGEWGLVLPDFTASLDAALTLVPEGYSWGVGNCAEDGIPWACVTTDVEPFPDYSGTAASPSLALCSAALRARAAIERSNIDAASKTQETES